MAKPEEYVVYYTDPILEAEELARHHGDFDLIDPADVQNAVDAATLSGAKTKASDLARQGVSGVFIQRRINIVDVSSGLDGPGIAWDWDQETVEDF